jgi:hypothetical protein
MHAIRVGDDADAFGEDQMLAALVLVGHGSRSRAEVHRQGSQARQRAGQFLHPHVVRAVEQRYELVRDRTSGCSCRRAELVHEMLHSFLWYLIGVC